MKTKIVEIIKQYIIEVPDDWTDDQIIFHWECTDKIEIKESEQIDLNVIDYEN